MNLTALAGSRPPVRAFTSRLQAFTGVVYYVSGFTPATLGAAQPDSDSPVVSEFTQGLVAAAPKTLSQMVIKAKSYTFHTSLTGKRVTL